MSKTTRILLLLLLALLAAMVGTVMFYPRLYRLGDVVRHDMPDLNVMTRIIYPDSIASRYLTTRRTSQELDFQVLDFLVPIYRNREPFVVHLRLGDVIENDERTALEFWNAPAGPNNRKHNDWCAVTGMTWVGSGDGAQTEGYVKDKSYYERAIQQVQNKSRVIIVGGTHSEHGMRKSREYVDLVRRLFVDSGFGEVEVKLTDTPDQQRADDDFALLCNALLYLPTGGGYSTLAITIVQMRGGVVLTVPNRPSILLAF